MRKILLLTGLIAGLTLLFVVLIPVVLLFLSWIVNRAFPMFGKVQQRLDVLNTVMQENLSGVRVVKAFVRARHEIGRFHRSNDNLMNQNIDAVRTVATAMPAMMLILNIGAVAALWIGGVQVKAGNMQVGQIIAFTNYLMQSLTSLMVVGMLVMRISRAEASAVRIEEVLNSDAAVTKRTGCAGTWRSASVTTQA